MYNLLLALGSEQLVKDSKRLQDVHCYYLRAMLYFHMQSESTILIIQSVYVLL